jgi:hypothetical protein
MLPDRPTADEAQAPLGQTYWLFKRAQGFARRQSFRFPTFLREREQKEHNLPPSRSSLNAAKNKLHVACDILFRFVKDL